MPTLMLPRRALRSAEGGPGGQGPTASLLTRVLAGIWLVPAFVGVASTLFDLNELLASGWGYHHYNFAQRAMNVFALGALWTPALAAAILILTQRCAGVGMLLAHNGFSTLLWPLYWLYVCGSPGLHTPPAMMLLSVWPLGLALFSAFSFAALSIDLMRDRARREGGG